MLDAEGRPTGRTELKYGKDGEAGYLRWLAANHPAGFGALYGKLIPLDINAKVEEKQVVRYETVEERRKAMIGMQAGRPRRWPRWRRRWSRNSCATCGERTRGRARL